MWRPWGRPSRCGSARRFSCLVNGFVNATPRHETQPNLTGPHMEVPPDQLDLPEPTSTALNPTISRSLAVKGFVGSSPIASATPSPPPSPPPTNQTKIFPGRRSSFSAWTSTLRFLPAFSTRSGELKWSPAACSWLFGFRAGCARHVSQQRDRESWHAPYAGTTWDTLFSIGRVHTRLALTYTTEYVLRRLLRQLLGADHLEVLVDEDVMGPVDADVVDLVFAVAQLHNTVDNPARVGGQRSFRRLVRCRSADDRP